MGSLSGYLTHYADAAWGLPRLVFLRPHGVHLGQGPDQGFNYARERWSVRFTMVSGSTILKAIAFAASWTILFFGLYAMVFDLVRGRTEAWMVFVPMWAVMTLIVTCNAVDDLRNLRNLRKR